MRPRGRLRRRDARRPVHRAAGAWNPRGPGQPGLEQPGGQVPQGFGSSQRGV